MKTTRLLLAALPIAAGCTFGAAVLSAKSGEDRVAPPATEFAPMQRYAIGFDKPRDVAEFYMRDFGFSQYDADFTELDHDADSRMRVVLVTVDGIEDDAVQGIQMRFGMRPSEGSWEAVEAGLRRKCYRGENAGKWTKDTCP